MTEDEPHRICLVTDPALPDPHRGGVSTVRRSGGKASSWTTVRTTGAARAANSARRSWSRNSRCRTCGQGGAGGKNPLCACLSACMSVCLSGSVCVCVCVCVVFVYELIGVSSIREKLQESTWGEWRLRSVRNDRTANEGLGDNGRRRPFRGVFGDEKNPSVTASPNQMKKEIKYRGVCKRH